MSSSRCPWPHHLHVHPLLGLAGIIGVKSGFTTAAGGCDVLAVIRPVHGRSTLLLAAVTGQMGPWSWRRRASHGLALVNAVQPLIGTSSVLRDGQLVAHVTEAGRTVDAQAAAPVSMLTWPGVQADRIFHPDRHLTDKARRGAAVGTVVVRLGTQQVAVPVRLRQDVPDRHSSSACSESGHWLAANIRTDRCVGNRKSLSDGPWHLRFSSAGGADRSPAEPVGISGRTSRRRRQFC